jgi:hypothetical protein
VPPAAQFVRGVIVLCRIIYRQLLPYRYPQPYFTFVSRGYFAAMGRASYFVRIFAVDRRPGSLAGSREVFSGNNRSDQYFATLMATVVLTASENQILVYCYPGDGKGYANGQIIATAVDAID